MKTITATKLTFWINQSPESFHSYDMERFYDFMHTMIQNEDLIDEDELRQVVTSKKPWIPEYVDEFVNEWMVRIRAIHGYIEYLKG